MIGDTVSYSHPKTLTQKEARKIENSLYLSDERERNQ